MTPRRGYGGPREFPRRLAQQAGAQGARVAVHDHEGDVMPGPGKRLPSQSNADYERERHDPNADFLGTQSVSGGGDPTWVMRFANLVLEALGRRKR